MGVKSEPEYIVWTNMKTRCYTPSASSYKRYGARGIGICERWRSSYQNFLRDMGRRPSPKHQLDRIDNSGDYNPSNCRWATASEQARNRRSNRWITANGETLCLSDWAKKLGCEPSSIKSRIARGWTPERAVSEPMKKISREGWKKLLTCRGETKSLSEWSDETGLSPSCISRRLKRGWNIEKALFSPLDGRGGK